MEEEEDIEVLDEEFFLLLENRVKKKRMQKCIDLHGEVFKNNKATIINKYLFFISNPEI